MKCSNVQELLGDYDDFPKDDLRRKAMDKHMERCAFCKEEFDLWTESSQLILNVKDDITYPSESPAITNRVMDRIYADESWRMPVNQRMYTIPYKIRRNLTAVISFCLAMFIFSFLFILVDGRDANSNDQESLFGIHQVASANDKLQNESLNVHMMTKTTFASAGRMIEPLKLDPIHSYPDYLLILSFLGIISTMMIMSWFSRTRT